MQIFLFPFSLLYPFLNNFEFKLVRLREAAKKSSSLNGESPLDGTPATQTVPEIWPVMPVIATNKNPVFPK